MDSTFKENSKMVRQMEKEDTFFKTATCSKGQSKIIELKEMGSISELTSNIKGNGKIQNQLLGVID